MKRTKHDNENGWFLADSELVDLISPKPALSPLAAMIVNGGQISVGIIFEDWARSRMIFRSLEGELQKVGINFRSSHASDLFELKSEKINLRALPFSDKMRGYRFQNIITDKKVFNSDIIRPVLATSTGWAFVM